MKKLLMILFAVLAVCVGCKKEVRTEKKVTPAARSYDALDRSDALVEVNGVTLTKGDLEDAVSVRRYLFSRGQARPNVKRLEGFVSSFRSKYPATWIRQTLFIEAFKKTDQKISDSLRKETEANYVKTFAKGKGTFAELAAACKKETGLDLSRQLETDLKLASFLHSFSNEWVVSDAEVSNGLARAAQYNAIAGATNVLVHLRATNVLNRITAGESFEKLADAFSEVKEDGYTGGDCGVKTADDFTMDAEAWAEIVALPVGGVSRIIERQDHLEIVRVTSIEKSESSGETGRRISRIWFKLPMFYPEMTADEVRSAFQREKQTNSQREWEKKLREQSKILYPNGKDALPHRPKMKLM